MSLFQVEGWNLPSQIAKEDPEDKKTKQKQKKKQKGKSVDAEQLQDMYKQAVDVKDKKKKKRKRNNDNDGKKDEKKSRTSEEEQPGEKEVKKPVAVEPAKKTDTTKLTPLQRKMQEKLAGSRFRWINEQLYTSTSGDALKLIAENPDMFDEYHNGFRSQVKSWPQNPVDAFLDQVKVRLNKPIAAPGGLPGDKDGTVVIADMGCGEAQFAKDLQSVKGHGKSKKAKFEVHSFDLKAANEFITVADIKNVPLPDESAHVVVFCLALMGTNFLDFIKEGLRILKPRGEIWIAEIKSRFAENDTKTFVNVLKDFGLMHKTTDDSNKMFVRFEFFKPPKDILEDQRKKKQKKEKPKFIEQEEHGGQTEGQWLLKPCIYKRR